MGGRSFSDSELRLMADVLRLLTIDAIEKTQSGHPGMPLGMADVATVLWAEFLNFSPQDPQWPGRDRFILSAGHGSMLQYALLHLTGFPKMTVEALKNFRQLGSVTPGHPEYGQTPGVEVTTGPLGQGVGNAVGMALAERLWAHEFGDTLAGQKTYVIAGDGCLMEGVTQEALSFAGHLGLHKLVLLFDDNGITIDGRTSLSTSDDHSRRFEASGWYVQTIDGHDYEAIRTALQNTASETRRPSLIACRTQIGYGAPTKAGTAKVHGSPLGPEEAKKARHFLGGELLAPFEVSQEARSLWAQVADRGKSAKEQWNEALAALPKSVQQVFWQRLRRVFPEGCFDLIEQEIASLCEHQEPLATRVWSQKVLGILGKHVPGLLGGSADLTPSNNTQIASVHPVHPGHFSGRYVHYGVREHGMMAILNGILLHGGFVPYAGTFLAFLDYLRPALRLAALMKLPAILVATHDSIGLGEDGPTHQPIEHLASLRAIPNLTVFRPACGVEVAECWLLAITAQRAPSVLALSRQAVSPLRPGFSPGKNLSAQGGYVLKEAVGVHQVTLFATGSEVELAVQVRRLMEEKEVGCRVVSMPAWRLFDQQPSDYRTTVLSTGSTILRVAIEAGVCLGWERYVGERGLICALDTFGASAPGKDLYESSQLTASAIFEKIKSALRG